MKEKLKFRNCIQSMLLHFPQSMMKRNDKKNLERLAAKSQVKMKNTTACTPFFRSELPKFVVQTFLKSISFFDCFR